MPAYDMTITIKKHPSRMWAGPAFRCGLSRPTAELDAIAELMELSYVLTAWVEDATLHVVPPEEDTAEGLVRMYVETARAALTEALAKAPSLLGSPDPVPAPTMAPGWTNPLRRDRLASAYGSKVTVGYRGFDYTMPEPWCGKAALVSEPFDGRTAVHFLHRFGHPKDAHGKLTKAIFSILARRDAVNGAYPDNMLVDAGDLARDEVSVIANASMTLAEQAVTDMKDRLGRLPVGGLPSAFTEDDNDARDIVLEALVAGHVIEAKLDEGKPGTHDGLDGDEDEPGTHYVLDGDEIPSHIFERLVTAGWLEADGDDSRSPSGSFRISRSKTVRPRDLAPREHAVSFAAFSERCRFRRFGDGRECARPDKYDQDTCETHGCPITTPVYRKEVNFASDDPFFGWDHERDVMVTADHPGTERSYAWRAAGEQRVEAIVNVVAMAYARYRAGYVCSEGEVKAAREAVAAGHLVVSEPSHTFLMVALPPETKARIERWQAKAA